MTPLLFFLCGFSIGAMAACFTIVGLSRMKIRKHEAAQAQARLSDVNEWQKEILRRAIEPFSTDDGKSFFMFYPGHGIGGKNYDPRKS